MITHEEITEVVPRHEKVVTKAKVCCDLCGKAASNYNSYDGSVSWKPGSYDLDETIVEWKEGSCFPGGGHGTYKRLHICPSCFKAELIPFMEARCKTGNFQVTETDWEI